MLEASVNDRKNTFKVAFITVWSIFIMGFMNAKALNTTDLWAMVSAQSGNIVWIGVYLGLGQWYYLAQTLMLFFGFVGGAILALYTQDLFVDRRAKFAYGWAIFVIPLISFPLLLQYTVHPTISFFVLGLSAGATLGFFRKVYHMEINSAMATASVRFVGLYFAKGFIKPKNNNSGREKSKFVIFLICVLAFALGACLYVLVNMIDNNLGIAVGIGNNGQGSSRFHSNYPNQIYGNSYNLIGVITLVSLCLLAIFFCPSSGKKYTVSKDDEAHAEDDAVTLGEASPLHIRALHNSIAKYKAQRAADTNKPIQNVDDIIVDSAVETPQETAGTHKTSTVVASDSAASQENTVTEDTVMSDGVQNSDYVKWLENKVAQLTGENAKDSYEKYST